MQSLRKTPLLWDKLSSIAMIEMRAFASDRAFDSSNSFKFSDLRVKQSGDLSKKPEVHELVFGHHFSDHMLEISWSERSGWGAPQIGPVHKLEIHPAAKVLHYASELFEGMKAYHGIDGKIRLFRPDLNMERMKNTAGRCGLPDFNGSELVRCIARLIETDQDWVPRSPAALYIRPTMIGTEPTLGVQRAKEALLYVLLGPVGPYFPTGLKPVSLFADPKFVRAWPGGAGAYKMGSNYAPTITVQKEAEKHGCQQVLWLFGEDHLITEVGTMNIFVFWINEEGERELVTPPLDGLILPGVTRRSLLDLARKWGDFKVSERAIRMKEVVKANKSKRLLEVFGAGTACVVCPVARILYQGQNVELNMEQEDTVTQRFYKELLDIQYGRTKHHPWVLDIDTLTGKVAPETSVEEEDEPIKKRAINH